MEEKIKDLTIKEFQEQLPWTIHYSKEFRENKQTHKDFAHALLHVTKAAGKLASFVDDLDHNKNPNPQVDEPDKFIADLVICALRMANTYPGGVIDLQNAVHKRLEGKNAVKLSSGEKKYPQGILAFKPSANSVRKAPFIREEFSGISYDVWCKDMFDDKSTIYKVKNTNNQIFTVGDYARYNYNKNKNSIIFQIESIRIIDNKIQVFSKNDDMTEVTDNDLIIVINTAEKLLRTLDGFDMLNGEEVYVVNRETTMFSKEKFNIADIEQPYNIWTSHLYAIFNKEEHAINYVSDLRKR